MAKILVIDDEDQVRKMLRKLLENNSYDILEAENGNEGLKVFMDQAPDIVLTDLIMPEQEGLETIKEIRKVDPDVKIIAMSGGGINNPAMYLKIASKLGAEHVFTKPVESQELLKTIEGLLEKDG